MVSITRIDALREEAKAAHARLLKAEADAAAKAPRKVYVNASGEFFVADEFTARGGVEATESQKIAFITANGLAAWEGLLASGIR